MDIRQLLDNLEDLTDESAEIEAGDSFSFQINESETVDTGVVELLEDGIIVQGDDILLDILAKNGAKIYEADLETPGGKDLNDPSSVLSMKDTEDSESEGPDMGKVFSVLDNMMEDENLTEESTELRDKEDLVAKLTTLKQLMTQGDVDPETRQEVKRRYIELMKQAHERGFIDRPGTDFGQTGFPDYEEKDAPYSGRDGKTFVEEIDRLLELSNLAEGNEKEKGSDKPVDPKDLVVPLSDVPDKKRRGHKQYDPNRDFPRVFKKEIDEAKYRGREVPLGKPMQGDVKKKKVYVKKPNGNVVKVEFGDKKMRIKKSNPKRRKSFRARHNCDNPGPRWKARYWSCRAW